VERKGLRDGSGGDGRFRGGLGQALAFRVLTDDPATCSVFCDRTRIPAQGFFGGEPGAHGALLINGEAPKNPKAEQPIQPGDLIELLMPGGGGYGPPSERDLALRERDRVEEYVSSREG
jgi:N-methylhydantoinase B